MRSSCDVEAFEDVGLQVELLVVADQPRIAVDVIMRMSLLAADQHAQRAAILAGLPAHRREIDDARALAAGAAATGGSLPPSPVGRKEFAARRSPARGVPRQERRASEAKRRCAG